jgi:RNA polymerase sigma-70 factor (ECF subfamily)
MSEKEMTGNLFLFSNPKAQAVKVSESKQAEAAMIERVCAGQRDAFDEFYKRFAPLVHGILIARLPRDEVDDIVQEVFMLAFQKISTLRDQLAAGAWVATIARNRAVEFYRNGRQNEELAENVPSRSNPISEANEALSAIRSLPDTYRETLVLRLIEGMTGAEIAEQTGLTNDSVRVNLHRGMKLLRQKLGVKQ